ncbi:MarR family transcriptional regulator [bacterium]|nr:MAG: MarR family transcriptional regulator [bacterium]
MSDDAIKNFANDVLKLMPDILREFFKRQTKEIAQGNISLPQILTLDLLKARGSMRMGELAKYLSVSMAAATGIADRLVRSGFVSRAGSNQDRRIVNISITTKGKKVAQEFNRARQKTIIEVFGALSGTDRDKYLELLNKIHKHIKRT